VANDNNRSIRRNLSESQRDWWSRCLVQCVFPWQRGSATLKAAMVCLSPNVWVRIGADDKATITLSMLEMGQGVMTSMPMLVAEELDLDWSKVETVWAPADPRYGNPNFGGAQLTAGSNSVRGMWKLLREAGASARSMLVTAARKPGTSPRTPAPRIREKSFTRPAIAGCVMVRWSIRPQRCPCRKRFR
jgi:hypothetical protein